MAACFCGKDEIGEINKRDILDSEGRAFYLPVALHGNLYLITGDAPNGVETVTGRKTKVMYKIGVLSDLFHGLTADIVMILGEKKTPLRNLPRPAIQIKDSAFTG